jgi:hypothetical protein
VINFYINLGKKLKNNGKKCFNQIELTMKIGYESKAIINGPLVRKNHNGYLM